MGPTKTFKNGPIARSVSFDNKSSIVNSTSQGKTEAVYGRQTARAALETSGKLKNRSELIVNDYKSFAPKKESRKSFFGGSTPIPTTIDSHERKVKNEVEISLATEKEKKPFWKKILSVGVKTAKKDEKEVPIIDINRTKSKKLTVSHKQWNGIKSDGILTRSRRKVTEIQVVDNIYTNNLKNPFVTASAATDFEPAPIAQLIQVERPPRRQSLAQTQGVFLSSPDSSGCLCIDEEQQLNLNKIEKGILDYFAHFPSLGNEQVTSILRDDSQITGAIKQYMRQKELDKWLFNNIIKNDKVMNVMTSLIAEYKKQPFTWGYQHEKEFCQHCGKALYSAVEAALADSLPKSTFETKFTEIVEESPAFQGGVLQMPHELRELLQILNYQTKKYFPKASPEASSEVIVARLFFLRYIVPAFSDELDSLEDMQMNMILGKYMNDYFQTLKAVPDVLMPLFIMDIEQIKVASKEHLSSISVDAKEGIFQGDSDAEILVKRWAEYFGKEWISLAIINNKKVKSTIDQLLLVLEDEYQNDFKTVSQEVQLIWGYELFSAVVDAIAQGESQIPHEFRQFIQFINFDVKNRLPKSDSEILVCKMMFMRYICAEFLTPKKGKLAEVSAEQHAEIIACMQAYVNGLEEVPEKLIDIILT
jgi:hypothetical protein